LRRRFRRPYSDANLKLQLPPSIRRTSRSLTYLFASLFSATLPAAEVARWEAAKPAKAQGIQLERAPDSDWRVEKNNSGSVARLKPSSDYYSRAAYRFSLGEVPSGNSWLVIEFLDRGCGLISVSPGVAQAKQSGIARVNSGLVRQAVLQYDQGHLPQRFSIQGLDYLHAVVLMDQQPPTKPAPLVEPAVKFTRPSQRVTSAAHDAAGPDSIAEVLAGLRNHLPLIRAIGFNGVESYVRWGWVERTPGVYDWNYYDTILDEIEKHGLRWFPMLMAGSGYALPEWLFNSTNNVGFQCLEHCIVHDTRSIFYPFQA